MVSSVLMTPTLPLFTIKTIDILSILQITLVFALILLTTQALYNLYLSPLSHFPGPKIRTISEIPYALTLLHGTDVKDHINLHKTYGPIVRTSPTTLSFTDARAWEDIHGASPTDRTVPKCDKDWAFYAKGLDLPFIKNSLLALRGVHHARVKRTLMYGLSAGAVRGYEGAMQELVAVLLRRIEEKVELGMVVDLNFLYNAVTFDVIGRVVLGEDLRQLEDMVYSSWSTSFQDALKYGGAVLALLSSPTVQGLVSRCIPKRFLRANDEYYDFGVRKMRELLGDESEKKTIWDRARRVAGPELGITEAEINANTVLLMMAGSEPVAALMSGLTFHLLRSPGPMQKLEAEIRASFSDANEIDMESVKSHKLPYLEACVQEALRLYPPSPAGLPRITPKGGIEIAGQLIPSNVRVYVHAAATSRSGANFLDADHFVPERWLREENETRKCSADNSTAHQPFAVGPHTCPGQTLALWEAKLVLTKVLWSFDLQICPECVEWDDQAVYVLWDRRKPLNVVATRRC